MQPAEVQNSITTTSSMDLNLHQHLDLHNKSNHQNILNTTTTEPADAHRDRDQLDLDHQDDTLDNNNIDHAGEYDLDYEPDPPYYCMDNNPPESYSVCESKVADWLDRNTFMERKASVKFACSKNLDYPCQTRASRRSVSLNQKPKLAIIGFRKKPIHHQSSADGRSNKHNNDHRVENVRLFRNRSEPGRDYCLLITEPVSPRVSCVGRVGSMRVQGRKAGVWRSFKAAFSNLVQTNRPVTKIAA